MSEQNPHRTLLYVILCSILVLALGYGGYAYLSLRSQNAELDATLVKTRDSLDAKIKELTEKITALEETLAERNATIAAAEIENDSLSEALGIEKDKMGLFEKQIKKIGGTVGTLEKLSKTDKELLQKYSKVYFLNEHYVPEKLTKLDKEYLTTKDTEQYIHAKALPFLEDLMQDAETDGMSLSITSAYRSFEMQSGLKSGYTVTYGTGANSFSADQGFSEHQLGTTVDFSSAEVGGSLAGFDTTRAYAWLLKNGYKYGFVLSYPKANNYYIFEPWHWRFVGKDLARYLRRENVYFYDLDQRKIDTYLVSIFD